MEGFEQNCGSFDCIQKNQIPDLRNNANQFSQLQNTIQEKYNYTTDALNTNANLLQQVQMSDDLYNDSNSYIPERYLPSLSSYRPNVTIHDGVKHDIHEQILYQNTLYIIGLIVSILLILIAIFVIKK
jgi:hypothetical protein